MPNSFSYQRDWEWLRSMEEISRKESTKADVEFDRKSRIKNRMGGEEDSAPSVTVPDPFSDKYHIPFNPNLKLE